MSHENEGMKFLKPQRFTIKTISDQTQPAKIKLVQN